MTVRSVANAIAILKHLAAAKPAGVNAVARAIGLSPSSCFNLLRTLADEGFVDFNAQTKTYRLGPGPAELFQHTRGSQEWMEGLREALATLTTSYLLTCGIWQVSNARVQLIEVIDNPMKTRIHLTPGQRLPILAGATGRCVAALEGLSKSEVRAKIIQGIRWQSPPTLEVYWREVLAAGKNGWAADRGNVVRGVTTLAAPVRGRGKAITHCLTATMFDGQCTNEVTNEIGRQLARLAADAAERRAYS